MNLTDYPSSRFPLVLGKSLVALFCALIASALFSSTALAAGQLTGHVTNTDNAPIPNLQVSLHKCHRSGEHSQCFWVSVRSVATNQEGYYEMPLDEIAANNYVLEFNGWLLDYEGEYYPGEGDLDEAEGIPLNADSQAVIDAVLTPFGKLTGVVTNSDGEPIAGVQVNTNSREGFTDATGTYTMAVVPNPTVISFVYGMSYRQEYYDNKYRFEDADQVVVAAGTTVTINAILEKAPIITGRVTDLHGIPRPNIYAVLYKWKIHQDGTGGSWHPNAYELADENGFYTFITVPGSYRLGFEERTDNAFLSKLATMYYPMANTVDEGETLEIEAEKVYTNINGYIGTRGIIEGRVTDLEGKPINAVVSFSKEPVEVQTGENPRVETDETGYFRFETFEPGVYYVSAISTTEDGIIHYAQEYYDDEADYRQADGIQIGPNQVVFLNMRLRPAIAIYGKVTNLHGDPIAGATIIFNGTNGVVETKSDNNGNYRYSGFWPVRTYTIFVSHPEYRRQFFSNYYGPGGIYDADVKWDQLYLQASSPDILINFHLLDDDEEPKDLAALYGIVGNQDQAPIPGIMVRAYRHKNGAWVEVGSDLSDNQGRFIFPVPDRGPYRLKFEDATFGQNDADYATLYYPNASTLADAQDIAVEGGYAGTFAILYDIPDLGGRVTNKAGAPVTYAQVRLYQFVDGQWQCCLRQTTTDHGGDYEFIDLPPGKYRLHVSASWLGYVNEYYTDATTVEEAEEITLSSGNGATVKDFILDPSAGGIRHTFLPNTRR